MSRFSAFAIHMGISLVIFTVLAYLVVFEWYPGILFDVDGGWRGMRIIVAVDLVLGPTLTLIVFKAGKPGLKTDLTLIGVFQAICLMAGTYVVWYERPQTVVYVDGRFQVMTTDDYRENGFDGVPDLSRIPGDWPKWVHVEVPENINDEADFRGAMIRRGLSIPAAVDHYLPFDPRHPQVADDAKPLDVIRARPNGDQALANWLNINGGQLEDYNFYLFTTRYKYGYAGFRKEDAELLGFLEVRPL